MKSYWTAQKGPWSPYLRFALWRDRSYHPLSGASSLLPTILHQEECFWLVFFCTPCMPVSPLLPRLSLLGAAAGRHPSHKKFACKVWGKIWGGKLTGDNHSSDVITDIYLDKVWAKAHKGLLTSKPAVVALCNSKGERPRRWLFWTYLRWDRSQKCFRTSKVAHKHVKTQPPCLSTTLFTSS